MLHVLGQHVVAVAIIERFQVEQVRVHLIDGITECLGNDSLIETCFEHGGFPQARRFLAVSTAYHTTHEDGNGIGRHERGIRRMDKGWCFTV
jgi:hypothetical protein